MVVSVTHAKVNNITDWTQAELDAQIAAGNYPAGTTLADITLPSDWNDTHTITGLATVASTGSYNDLSDKPSLSSYVPYTGATSNVDLGANALITDKITSDTSAGLILENTSGGDVLHIGAGGGVNATAYGGWNFDGATANTIASFGASKTLTSLSTSTYPSLTELSYVKGVTSAVQTQIDNKINKASPVTNSGNYTLTTNDSGKLFKIDCTSGAATFSLLSAATAGAGFEVTIEKSDFSGNFCNVTANGSDLIDDNGPQFNVTNATNNGSGLVRIAVAESRTMKTGDKVVVANVGGVTAANGTWTITRISDQAVDLQSSTFSGSYTSGGTITQIRTVIPLRVQSDYVTLVSDGVSRWTIKSGNINTLGVRDIMYGWNPGYNGFDFSTSLWIDVDYFYSSRVQRFQTRSLAIGDVGDPPDLAIRRAEGTYGAYTAPASNTNIGTIYWQALAGNTQSYEGQNAGIYCRAQGTQTSTSSAGRLVLGTTKTNELQATDGLEIDHVQWVYLGGNSSTRAVTVRQDGATSYIQLRNASSSQVTISAEGSASDVAFNIASKGTNQIDLYTNGGSQLQVRVAHTASANRALTLTGSNGGNPSIGTTAGNIGFTASLESPTLITPALGTPSSGTLTNCTGLPISTGVSGLGSNVATFLATPSSANLAAALTDETGTAGTVPFRSTGTWTVNLYDAVTGGNVSATTVTGNYTRTGNEVTIYITGLNNISTAGMTGANVLYFSLPFTPARRSIGHALLESFTYPTSRVQAYSAVIASQARGRFFAGASGQTAANFTVASITSGTSDIVDVVLTYEV